MKGAFTDEELSLARQCVEMASGNGIDAIRISASKTLQNSINLRDGKVEKISFSEERSFFFNVFADGRYGTFSTNRLDAEELDRFLKKAALAVQLMEKDECYSLPDPSRKAVNCNKGNEMGLIDDEYWQLTQEDRTRTALDESNRFVRERKGIRSILFESEYSDSIDDSYLIDSDGFEGRHTETHYGFSTEATVMDANGSRYSGYWWERSPHKSGFHPGEVLPIAYEMAAARSGPRKTGGGRYDIVVDRSCAARLLAPILNALDGTALQQGKSFLCNCLGKKIFNDNFTLGDNAVATGLPGSRLFDSEGVSTGNRVIIRNGTVEQFFIDEYISRKTGWKPTVNSISRPCISPFICNCDKKEINLEDIVKACGSGLYITGFNGGNCNSTSGNFSYGIEGFRFEKGVMLHPFHEMLMTGNIAELFRHITAAGSDSRKCSQLQVPTLAFEQIDINE